MVCCFMQKKVVFLLYDRRECAKRKGLGDCRQGQSKPLSRNVMTTGRETVAVRKFDSFLSRQQQMQQWTSRALNYLFSPPGTRVKSQYGQLFFLHFHRRRHRHRTVLAVSLNSEQQLKTRKISSWFKWNKIRWKLIRNNESSEQKREVSRSWLDRLPKRIQPYLRVMRLDKPVGFLLLYWPCTWGVAVASPPLSLGDFADFVHVVLSEPAAWSALAYHPVTSLLSSLTLFGLGAFFARSAGCVRHVIVFPAPRNSAHCLPPSDFLCVCVFRSFCSVTYPLLATCQSTTTG